MKLKNVLLKGFLTAITVGFLFAPYSEPLFALEESQPRLKTMVGASEFITIFPEGMTLSSKIDTGAVYSSLDAQNIEYFTRDEKEWVRFQVNRALQKKIYTLERPIERISHIKSRAQENGSKEPIKRPSIKLQVCMGGETQEIEVNLTDRSHFKYPFLLGKTALISFNKTVDPAANELLPSSCTMPTGTEKE